MSSVYQEINQGDTLHFKRCKCKKLLRIFESDNPNKVILACPYHKCQDNVEYSSLPFEDINTCFGYNPTGQATTVPQLLGLGEQRAGVGVEQVPLLILPSVQVINKTDHETNYTYKGLGTGWSFSGGDTLLDQVLEENNTLGFDMHNLTVNVHLTAEELE